MQSTFMRYFIKNIIKYQIPNESLTVLFDLTKSFLPPHFTSFLPPYNVPSTHARDSTVLSRSRFGVIFTKDKTFAA